MIALLNQQSGDKNKYVGSNLTLDATFRYKLAEKLHTDNTIDYSGHVRECRRNDGLDQ